MKRHYFFSILAILILILVVGFDHYLDERVKSKIFDEGAIEKSDTNLFFLPTSTTNQIVHHQSYSLSYSEAHEQAEWIAYELKASHIRSTNFKRPYFKIDKAIKTKAAHWNNYKNSGYTRGHLCPAADRKYSQSAHDETFLTSNVSPQTYEFNAGIWNRLEQKVRYWAQRHDGVFVVTGGILNDELKTIGAESVAVPEYFYKIILDYNNGDAKAIAFLLPHENASDPLYNYVVPIDAIETLTQIDFFVNLDDALEDRIEATSDYKKWGF